MKNVPASHPSTPPVKSSASAIVHGEPPETPLLDALEEQEASCYRHQISRPGIFLPTPGLLGEVEVPQAAALSWMARALWSFDLDLMRLVTEKYPTSRKEVADALLLAETIWMRDNSEEINEFPGETRAQLFSRWAMTGTDFEEFEKILAEKAARNAAKRARPAAPPVRSGAADSSATATATPPAHEGGITFEHLSALEEAVNGFTAFSDGIKAQLGELISRTGDDEVFSAFNDQLNTLFWNFDHGIGLVQKNADGHVSALFTVWREEKECARQRATAPASPSSTVAA